MVGREKVTPTDEDVDKCIRYLRANNRLVCQKTVHETVRQYLQGTLEIKDELDTSHAETNMENLDRTLNPELSPREASEVSDSSEEFESQLKRDMSVEKKDNQTGKNEHGDETL